MKKQHIVVNRVFRCILNFNIKNSRKAFSIAEMVVALLIGSKSKKGGGWEVGADFNARGYSDVYKDGLNEVRPKNIAYLACKKN